jgi:uncharacterized coiled-coil protein SlyX
VDRGRQSWQDIDMANEPDNIVIVFLRRIDQKIDLLAADVQDLKQRVTSLEGQFAHLQSDIARLHGDFAGQSARMDRIEQRLDRIERRLDLVGAH